jgi:hypothetical protein
VGKHCCCPEEERFQLSREGEEEEELLRVNAVLETRVRDVAQMHHPDNLRYLDDVEVAGGNSARHHVIDFEVD